MVVIDTPLHLTDAETHALAYPAPPEPGASWVVGTYPYRSPAGRDALLARFRTGGERTMFTRAPYGTEGTSGVLGRVVTGAWVTPHGLVRPSDADVATLLAPVLAAREANAPVAPARR